MRGLKLAIFAPCAIYPVAPYVGAWIETKLFQRNNVPRRVAPYVGAWIETRRWLPITWIIIGSHPTWVRGLKLHADERNAGNQ